MASREVSRSSSSTSSRSCSYSGTSATHDEDKRRSYDSLSYTSDDHDFTEKEPIFSHSFPTVQNPRKGINASRLYRSRIPNRIMRFICLGLAGGIVLLIFSLWRASATSDRMVLEMGKKKPPTRAPWKAFSVLERYYGGLRSITEKDDNIPESLNKDDQTQEIKSHSGQASPVASSSRFNPYPAYKSADYIKKYGEVMDCFLDDKELIRPPMIHVYHGVPMGMPENAYGSYEVLGLNSSNCLDRYGRYGPYGYGYSTSRGGTGAGMDGGRESVDQVWKGQEQIDFSRINWGKAQRRCAEKNAHRFNNAKKQLSTPDFTAVTREGHGEGETDQHWKKTARNSGPPSESSIDGLEKSTTNSSEAGLSSISRQAVVIRTWDDFDYTEEHKLFLRSLISELSLSSGGEFDIHFLIQVKSHDIAIWADDETYQKHLCDSLPSEFGEMGTLWSEKQMQLLYSGIEDALNRPNFPDVFGWYRSAHLPLQYFSKLHPEYDFIWNWEMDVRYIGNWYDLFTNVGRWAAEQPRKGLWERNNRFYIPETHGSWEEFKHMAKIQSEMPPVENPSLWTNIGSNGMRKEPELYDVKPVWGPEWSADDRAAEPFPDDPAPPTTQDKDKYEWGVGEEADLILFNPIFDPARTDWTLADDFNGYSVDRNRGSSPPRRTSVVASGRLSRRLLNRMHREAALRKHTMSTEMFVPSMALHHGLKAVYAPHPVFMERAWPAKYLAATLNPGPNGEVGRHRTTVFGDCCQHNLLGTTWHYNADFAPALWQRWLGLKVNGKGGEAAEMHGEGRMCLPPMLFHPVKNITLPVRKTTHMEN